MSEETNDNVKPDETKKEDSPSLSDLIKESEKEAAKAPVEEKVKEETTEEETKEDGSTKADFSDEDLTNAKNLYLALKDPDAAKIVISALAEKEGLLGKKEDTKADKQEKVESIQDIIKEALGKEYGFLSNRLGPAIEKIIGVGNKDIKETLKQQKEAQAQAEIDSALEKIGTEYPKAVELEEEMSRLMEEIKPGPKTTPYNYFKTLLFAAAANKGVNLTKKADEAKVDRVKLERNKKDASSSLASEGSTGSDDSVSSDSSNLTLEQIIRQSAKEVAEKKS